jgi:two-component system CheB/CheR fusion protein
MELVCQTARNITGADGSCFVLREDHQVYYCEEDAIAPLWKGERFPIENCISGWAILHSRPVAISDIYQDTRVPIEFYKETFIKSLAMMPIREGDPLGSIGVYWSDNHEATWDELDRLKMLADTTAIALVNSRLFDDLRAARKLAEDQANQLEQVNRLKDEFLSIVSQELRTPLNAIIGSASALRKRDVDDVDTIRGLETIERNAKAQARIVNELLDVSGIVSGKMKLAMNAVEIARVVEMAVDSMQTTADLKGIGLSVRIDPTLTTIPGDDDRLLQVVWKLLSNAVKFTDSGGRISVNVERIGENVEIEIADTGIGISQEFLPYVFDRFRQEDSSTTRKFGGLGLGLAITRHLIELHCGKIQVESPGEGQGATFRVILPIVARQKCDIGSVSWDAMLDSNPTIQ